MVPGVKPVVVKPPISAPFPALVPAPIQIPCFLFLLLCLFFLFEDRKAQKHMRIWLCFIQKLHLILRKFYAFMETYSFILLVETLIVFINICFIYSFYDVYGHENLPLHFYIFISSIWLSSNIKRVKSVDFSTNITWKKSSNILL